MTFKTDNDKECSSIVLLCVLFFFAFFYQNIFKIPKELI